MAAPVYRLRDLRLELAARPVLDIPTLDLSLGEVTAFVGPNGAGKTTLLRVLALLLPPTAGTVEFRGQPVSYRARNLTDFRQQVTMVGQSPLLFRRSVRANVAYGLRAHRRPVDGRVESALAAVGLAGFADRPAWKLSGGESQRVAIARALAIDPSVYLFDEPTANVDREYVGVIETVIVQLGAAGKTVILTSHNLEQAYHLSDRVVSLVSGRITPAPLVNVLRGATTRRHDAYYFESDGLRIEIADAATPQVIAITPEDIVVSVEPLHSSARNSFPGHIVSVDSDDRGIVLAVDCGRPLVARITRHSYAELGLNIGTAVWLTFKSSAIHLLSE